MANNKNRNVNITQKIIFCGFILCFFVTIIFAAGCNTISQCEPCRSVDDDITWNAAKVKNNLLNKIYNKKQKDKNFNLTNSNKTKKTKSNATSYLTIPPPPDSPE
jgi:hypothetical protein